MRHLLPSFVVLLALLPLSATTLEKLTLDDMIQKSTAIVRARAQGCSGEMRGPIIYSHCKLAVSERWKGGTGPQADVYVPGGTVNGRTQTFAGAPRLTEGQEYVLFLWTGKSGMTQIIGLSQGAFDLSTLGKGQSAVVSRSASSEPMIDAQGNRVQDDFVRMGIAQFKALVISGLARGEQHQ